jgi:hypothetical protein
MRQRTLDADIRAQLVDSLASERSDLAPLALIHEVRIPRPSAVVDLIAVSACLSAFEIKSDADNLGRLHRQVKAYSIVFDRVTLVTTLKHLKKSLDVTPPWWGILYCDPCGLHLARKGQQNLNASTFHQLYMLEKRELRSIYTNSYDSEPVSRWRHAELVEALSTVNDAVLRLQIRMQLAKRVSEITHSSSARV